MMPLSSPVEKAIKLPFSIESILGNDPHLIGTPGLSLSGSFSSTYTSSESSSVSPPLLAEQRLAQLEFLTKKRMRIEQDSTSTSSPESKVFNTPEKSNNRLSEDFSPLWNDILARQISLNEIRKQITGPLLKIQDRSTKQIFENQDQTVLKTPIKEEPVSSVSQPSSTNSRGYVNSQAHLVRSLSNSSACKEINGKSPTGHHQQTPQSVGRSPRVPFSRQQVMVLEAKFRKTHYLSSLEVTELAQQLRLTETRVKIWFQNRRARERRESALNNLSSPTENNPGIPQISEAGIQPSELNRMSTFMPDLVSGMEARKIGFSPVSPLEQETKMDPSAISQLTPLLLQACWSAQNQMNRDSNQEMIDPNEKPPMLQLNHEAHFMQNGSGRFNIGFENTNAC